MLFEVEKKDYQIQEGLVMLKKYIRSGYITKMLNLPSNTVSIAIKGKRGRFNYHLPYKHVPRVNELIQTTAHILFCTYICDKPVSAERNPIAYGDNAVDMVKRLCKVVPADVIFVQHMKKDKTWVRTRFFSDDSKKRVKINQDDLDNIDTALNVIAMKLAEINIVLPPGVTLDDDDSTTL